jgi:hypothetical protein
MDWTKLVNVSALDLYWLADHSADLAEMRLKGTPRPWQQAAQWDAEAREAADYAAATERAERSPMALGEHPAPLHLDVLDLLVNVVAEADRIAEVVAQVAGVDRMASASSPFIDPAPYFRHAARWLHQAAEADPVIGARVELDAARLRLEVSRALGITQRLAPLEAACPWCGGGVAAARTLYIRETRDGRAVVVCQSGACEPPEADCGERWRGHPAWDVATEGAWLADRIERMESA